MDGWPEHPFEVNGITIDLAGERLRDRAGREIPLRAQSFAVLRHLAQNADGVVTKDELMAAVWRGVAVTDDSLVQCVRDIRRALGDESATVLRTVPKRGYRLVPPPAKRAAPARRWRAVAPLTALFLAALFLAAAGWWFPAPEPAPGRPPSVAVLPFDDMSADASLGYMGRGVAEDIIAMLARSPDVLVVARNSSFAYDGKAVDVRTVGAELGVEYVLEGSVRREGDKLRIVAQLNDAESGEHLWAERFDKVGPDPWALQDEVAARIINELAGERGQFRQAQYREAWGKDTGELGEYDYFLRGLDVHMSADSKEAFDRAGGIWREGLRRFPGSPLLKVKLAWNHWTVAWDFWSDDAAVDFAMADRLVTEVLATDNLAPEVRRSAHWLNALVSMQRGDFDWAVAEAELAVSMAPYDARMLRYLTEVLIASGKYQTALEWLATAEPREPGRTNRYRQSRGNLYRLMHRYDDALREYAEVRPLGHYHTFSRAIVYVRLGRLAEARADVRAALAEFPIFTQTRWRESSFYADPAVLEGEIADLAAAGLPE